MAYTPGILERKLLNRECWNPEINQRLTSGLFDEIKKEDNFENNSTYQNARDEYANCASKRALYAPIISFGSAFVSFIIIVIIIYLFYTGKKFASISMALVVSSIYLFNVYFAWGNADGEFYTNCKTMRSYGDFQKYKEAVTQMKAAEIQAAAFRQGQKGSSVSTGLAAGIGSTLVNKFFEK